MQLLEPMLDRYIGTPNEPKTLHCLKADVENVLQSLKQHCGYTYKDILLMMLLEGEEERKQIISKVLQLQPVPIFHLRGCWELKPVPMLKSIFEPILGQYVGQPMAEQNLNALKLAVTRKIADLVASGFIPQEYASISPEELVSFKVINCSDVIIIFRDDLRKLLAELGLS